MKLLTHNMLTSHVKGVTKGYPLLIKATEVKVNEVDFNPQFVSRMIPKLEWSALVQAADEVCQTPIIFNISQIHLKHEYPSALQRDKERA
ncbi:multifunctional methyltransferase subunit TRM112-like protein [Notothenia coriiceps]|uniref:Multifunctional methyltransferase subunit TRM112-like protein n=1 Tax=Notothenia coriiceps TaxID=8208 RepID=A0A6I9PVD9_9TELE|nr:PREDICTED: multifunctional methyltransferase subunit TRM112-like protein [Notothenia coriiceps]